MRPTIDHLFDQTLRVWRPTVTKSDLGVEETSYSIVATLGAAVNRAVDPVADVGAGLAPVGRRRFFLRPDVNVQTRDVLEITVGSEAPGKWEVDQPPSRPRSHHTQVDAVAWHGELEPNES